VRASPIAQPGWKDRFIHALALIPNVAAACRAAGVSRQTAYKHKGEDPEFGAAWATALEESVDRLEQAAFERSVQGVPRTYEHVTYNADGSVKSRVVRTETVYSDRMTEMLLKAHRPERFRERYDVTMHREGDVDAEIAELSRELNVRADEAPATAEPHKDEL
jgi:hypothetical protein